MECCVCLMVIVRMIYGLWRAKSQQSYTICLSKCIEVYYGEYEETLLGGGITATDDFLWFHLKNDFFSNETIIKYFADFIDGSFKHTNMPF